jgi:protocatechuate 3,4-dioxygenase beta subunit
MEAKVRTSLDPPPDGLTRRRFVALSLVAPPAVALAAGTGLGLLVPTPACAEEEASGTTPGLTAGPFYKPGAPRRQVLIEPGTAGTPLLLRGRVLTMRGGPVAGAKLDFWQADAEGHYDNEGYRLRGNQLSDEEGHYVLRTVVPAGYLDRTPHIHVKVEPAAGRNLTTQLFFPGEPANREDPLFQEPLLMRLRKNGGRAEAAFDFVLDIG